MRNQINIFKNTLSVLLFMTVLIFAVSCEDSFKFDLPEAGSIADATLPEAGFYTLPDAENFKIVKFVNTSSESNSYSWDFGTNGVVCNVVDGVIVCGSETTSTDKDVYAKFDAGEGTYPVTLVSSDSNGASNTITQDVDVLDVFVPIPVTVLNGDFNDGSANWNIASFSDGGTTTPFNTSSDGSPLLYDGTASGGTKTAGAKWTSSTTLIPHTTASRYAYQAINVSPSTVDRTVKYILEYEYSIKTDAATDPPGGRRIVAEILDGHFDDGVAARNSTPLAIHEGTEVLGKGTFTTVQLEFTANFSGEVAIWIYGHTPKDAYVDNVKVYPVD